MTLTHNATAYVLSVSLLVSSQLVPLVDRPKCDKISDDQKARRQDKTRER